MAEKETDTPYQKAYIDWHKSGGVAKGPAPDPKKHGIGFNQAIAERDKLISAGRLVGNNPMPTAGSGQPHGYGHTASQRDGALRLSGNPKAHRIGKR